MVEPLEKLPPGIPERLGRYRLVRRLGGGGMGMVFEGVDETLGRRIALKVMRADRSVPERFRREGRALAKLRDPRILEIYELGEGDGLLFIATEFLEGEDLDSIFRRKAVRSTSPVDSGPFHGRDSAESPVPSNAPPAAFGTVAIPPPDADWIQGVTAWIRDAALALHHAHREGVIHRDIKPANLFICKDGGLKVIDFGLARDLKDRTITNTGDFMGTPAYMSPEQILTGRIGIDHRTDIYSLGVVLYQLLALTYPYPHKSSKDLCRQIVLEDPPPLRMVAPWVGRDLETVVLAAMAKNPRHRYRTAGAMAEDLESVLAGRPLVHAQRAGAITRKLRRSIRRLQGKKRQAVAVGAGIAIACAVFGGWWIAGEMNRSREISEASSQFVLSYLKGDPKKMVEANKKIVEARKSLLRFPEVRESFFSWQKKMEARREVLKGTDRPAPGENGQDPLLDGIGESLGTALEKGFRPGPPLVVPPSEEGILPAGPRTLLIDGAGRHAIQLTGEKGGIWDLRTGGFLGTFDWRRVAGGSDLEVTGLKARDSGLEAEIREALGSAVPLDPEAGDPRGLLPEEIRKGLPLEASLALSSRGNRLAVGMPDGSVQLFDLPGGRSRIRLGRAPGRTRRLALSPDGRILAASGDDGEIWTAEILPRAIASGPLEPRGLSVAEDGSFLAAAGVDGRISVYGFEDGEWSLRKEVRARGVVTAIRAYGGGQLVVWGELDGSIFAAEASPPGSPRKFGSHSAAVWALEIAGDRLFSAGSDGAVRAWSLAGRRFLWKRRICDVPGGLFALTASPQGDTVHAGGMDGRIYSLDAHTGENRPPPDPDKRAGIPITLLASGELGTLWILRVDGSLERRASGKGAIISAAYDFAVQGDSIRGAGVLVMADWNGWISLHGTGTKHFRLELPGAGTIVGAGLLSGGSLLLAAGDRVDPRPIRTLILPPELLGALGREEVPLVAEVGSSIGDSTGAFARLEGDQEASTASSRTVPPGGSSASAILFLPPGRRVATGHADGRVRIWDVATGAEIWSWRAHEGSIDSLAATGDGKFLVTADLNKETGPGEKCLFAAWETGEAIRLHWRREVQGSVDLSTVRESGRLVSWEPSGTSWIDVAGNSALPLETRSRGTWSVLLSPDGSRLAIQPDHATIKVIDARTGAFLWSRSTDLLRPGGLTGNRFAQMADYGIRSAIIMDLESDEITSVVQRRSSMSAIGLIASWPMDGGSHPIFIDVSRLPVYEVWDLLGGDRKLPAGETRRILESRTRHIILRGAEHSFEVPTEITSHSSVEMWNLGATPQRVGSVSDIATDHFRSSRDHMAQPDAVSKGILGIAREAIATTGSFWPSVRVIPFSAGRDPTVAIDVRSSSSDKLMVSLASGGRWAATFEKASQRNVRKPLELWDLEKTQPSSHAEMHKRFKDVVALKAGGEAYLESNGVIQMLPDGLGIRRLKSPPYTFIDPDFKAALYFENDKVSFTTLDTGQDLFPIQLPFPSEKLFPEAFFNEDETVLWKREFLLSREAIVWSVDEDLLYSCNLRFPESGGPVRSSSGDRSGDKKGRSRSIEIAVSRDGRFGASLQTDDLIVWDTRSRDLLWSVPEKCKSGILRFSPEGGRLALGRSEGSLTVWSASQGAQIGEHKPHAGAVTALEFSSGGTLFSGGADGGVVGWDPSGIAPTFRRDGLAGGVTAIVHDAEAGLLAASCSTGFSLVWKGSDPNPILVPSGGQISFSPDGENLSTLSDGTLTTWSLKSMRSEAVVSVPDLTLEVGQISGLACLAGGVVWTEAVGYSKSRLCHASVESRKEIRTISEEDRLSMVAASLDGKRLLAASRDGIGRLFEVGTWKDLAKIETCLDGITDLALSPTGRYGAFLVAGRCVEVWDLEKGEPDAILPCKTTVFQVEFAADEKSLFLSTEGGVSAWTIGSVTRTVPVARKVGEWTSCLRTLFDVKDVHPSASGDSFLMMCSEDSAARGKIHSVEIHDPLRGLLGRAGPYPHTPILDAAGGRVACAFSTAVPDSPNVISFYDLASGYRLMEREFRSEPVPVDFVLSPDRRKVIYKSGRGWAVRPVEGPPEPRHIASGEDTVSLAIAGDGSRVACLLRDGTIEVRDPFTGETKERFVPGKTAPEKEGQGDFVLLSIDGDFLWGFENASPAFLFFRIVGEKLVRIDRLPLEGAPKNVDRWDFSVSGSERPILLDRMTVLLGRYVIPANGAWSPLGGPSLLSATLTPDRRFALGPLKDSVYPIHAIGGDEVGRIPGSIGKGSEIRLLGVDLPGKRAAVQAEKDPEKRLVLVDLETGGEMHPTFPYRNARLEFLPGRPEMLLWEAGDLSLLDPEESAIEAKSRGD